MNIIVIIFREVLDKILFNRVISTISCISISLASYVIEYKYSIKNFFSSSGSIFTIAGLFLNIKLVAIFHLKLPNGKPLTTSSKYALITKQATFGGKTPTKDQEKKVQEIEADEICGAFLMIIGTIIWGYGSYFI